MDGLAFLGLATAGFVAGVVNTLAGGGSFLTVPALVLLGLPGGIANGTNRVGVLLQTGFALRRFRSEAVVSLSDALPVLGPVALGSVIGALVITRVPDAFFERAFGVVMIALWVATWLGNSGKEADTQTPRPASPWRHAALFGLGLYGGAFQAGVGLLLLLVLRLTGLDLLRANALKIAVNFCFTLLALPIFIISNQVAWLPAAVLGGGFALGGEVGARLAIRGGEKLLRPVLGLAIFALAGHMLGLY